MTTFESIAELVRETLAQPQLDVRAEALLFDDLGFTSLDLLDLLFRIEDKLGVHIAEGTLYRIARGELDDAAFAIHGVLTPSGRERLIALLPDTPRAVFPDRIDARALPRYATVDAIARLVDHLRVGGA